MKKIKSIFSALLVIAALTTACASIPSSVEASAPSLFRSAIASEVAGPGVAVTPIPSSMPVIAPVDFPVPDADIAGLLMTLAKDWKTLGVLGIIMLFTLLTVQLSKRFIPEDFKYKRIIVLCVAIIYSVLAGIFVPGSNVLSVIVTVFITSGGAVAMFEALKGLGVFKFLEKKSA